MIGNVAVSDVRARTRTSSHIAWLGLAIVIVTFCLPLFLNIGRTDFENDEAAHSLTVEAMVNDGAWLTPKNVDQGGVPFLEKPPLKFWLVAVPIRLGLLPDNEFGMRFWDAVIATIAFLYVFAIGRRLAGVACGLGAVLILFAHQPLLFDHGLLANDMESTLVLAYSAGVYHLLRWFDEADAARRRRHVFAIALYVALAFMVKFVAIAFLPVVLAVVTLASRTGRSRLRADWRVWLAAGALSLALVAPWFLYEWHQFGKLFWQTILGDQVVTRFTAYLDPNHLNPWHYYWSTIARELWTSGAGVSVAIGVILLAIQTVRRRFEEGPTILLWFVLPVTLMSLMTSKLYHYAYPYLPPLALAGGYAAAVAAGDLWRLAAPWAARVDSMLDVRLPVVLRSKGVRWTLVVLGAAAAAIAIATHATGGNLRLAFGGVTILRSASAPRAWFFAVVILALGRGLGHSLRLALVALLVAVLLPVAGAGRTFARLPREQHPLRTIGRCLQDVAGRARPGDVGSGMWIEATGIAHFYYYYFHRLGVWNERDIRSDAAVFTHLVVPSMQTPVLLSARRNSEYQEAVDKDQRKLLEWVARRTGLDTATLKADFDASYTATIVFGGREYLLLPGPFSVCAVEYERSHGR